MGRERFICSRLPLLGEERGRKIIFSTAFSLPVLGDAAGPGGEPIRDGAGNFYGRDRTRRRERNVWVRCTNCRHRQFPVGPWTEAVLHSFNGTDGTLPVGPLLLGPGGVLYGTANGGGDSGEGLVFELDPPATSGDAWTENILHAFGGDGSSPANGVIADKRGRLFGTAGGTVFMLTKPRVRGGAWTGNHSALVLGVGWIHHQFAHHSVQECALRSDRPGRDLRYRHGVQVDSAIARIARTVSGGVLLEDFRGAPSAF